MQERIKKILLAAAGVGILWMAGSQAAQWVEIRETIQEDVTVEEEQGEEKDTDGQDSGKPGDARKGKADGKTEDPDGTGRKIALTFDDGPHPSFTEELLDGLKERGVKASFFVLGEHVQLHPDIVKRMKEEGHLIGNHTYSHMQLKKGNWDEYRQELIKTNEVIREVTGQETTYVRPPYGCWDTSFEEELNMFPVLWTVDSRDWCSKDAAGVAQKVAEETEEGDIILMHDYYASSVDAALSIVDSLQAEGYTFVTVEEILFD